MFSLALICWSAGLCKNYSADFKQKSAHGPRKN